MVSECLDVYLLSPTGVLFLKGQYLKEVCYSSFYYAIAYVISGKFDVKIDFNFNKIIF